MGTGWLDDPLVQSALLPLAVALGATLGLARLLGTRAAAAAIVVGLVAGYAVIQGSLAWPPVGSSQKLPWAVLAGLLVGAGLLARPLPRAGRVALGSAALGVSLVWIAWPLLTSGGPERWLEVAALSTAGALALWLLDRAAERDIEAPLMLLVAAAAGGPIGLAGATASLAQLCGALAAATGGFLLCNWPRFRHSFGPIGVCSAGTGLMLILSQMALYTETSHAALATLLCVMLGSEVARRVPWLLAPPRALRDRLVFVALSGAPAALAVWIAQSLQTTDSMY